MSPPSRYRGGGVILALISSTLSLSATITSELEEDGDDDYWSVLVNAI